MHLWSGNRENISSVRRSARSVFCARRWLRTVWKSIISLIRALHWLSRNHHCERQRPKALFFNSQCRPTFSNVFPSDTFASFYGLNSVSGISSRYVLYYKNEYYRYDQVQPLQWNRLRSIELLEHSINIF